MKRGAHTESKQMKNQQGQTKQIFRPLAAYLKMTFFSHAGLLGWHCGIQGESKCANTTQANNIYGNSF